MDNCGTVPTLTPRRPHSAHNGLVQCPNVRGVECHAGVARGVARPGGVLRATHGAQREDRPRARAAPMAPYKRRELVVVTADVSRGAATVCRSTAHVEHVHGAPSENVCASRALHIMRAAAPHSLAAGAHARHAVWRASTWQADCGCATVVTKQPRGGVAVTQRSAARYTRERRCRSASVGIPPTVSHYNAKTATFWPDLPPLLSLSPTVWAGHAFSSRLSNENPFSKTRGQCSRFVDSMAIMGNCSTTRSPRHISPKSEVPEPSHHDDRGELLNGVLNTLTARRRAAPQHLTTGS